VATAIAAAGGPGRRLDRKKTFRRVENARAWSADRWAVVAAFILIAALTCFVPARADTFWHLRAGQDIVASRQVSLVDAYSYTAAGRPWPNHEWLWQVATYAAYAAGGMPLLTLFAAAIGFSTIVLVFACTRGSTRARLALVALALPLSAAPWNLRPQLFTLLAMAATLRLTLSGRTWALPPLFLLWANVHGAVALGGGVLVAAIAVSLHERAWKRSAALAGLALVCAAATTVTPLGLGLYRFIAESMEKSRANDITEWRPALQLAARPVGFLLASAALVALTLRGWRRLPATADRIAVVAALLFIPLGLRATRNIAVFAVLAAPAASRLLVAAPLTLPSWARRQGEPHPARPRDPRPLAGLAVLAVATVAFAWSRPLALFKWQPIAPGAVAAIRACGGNLFNQYNEGGVLLWFVPEKRVFVDSRQDPYPLELMRTARDLTHDDPLRQTTFARYGIGCAALPADADLGHRLAAEGWSEAYRDRAWRVLAAPDP
jgi:hypothetical protein